MEERFSAVETARRGSGPQCVSLNPKPDCCTRPAESASSRQSSHEIRTLPACDPGGLSLTGSKFSCFRYLTRYTFHGRVRAPQSHGFYISVFCVCPRSNPGAFLFETTQR